MTVLVVTKGRSGRKRVEVTAQAIAGEGGDAVYVQTQMAIVMQGIGIVIKGRLVGLNKPMFYEIDMNRELQRISQFDK